MVQDQAKGIGGNERERSGAIRRGDQRVADATRNVSGVDDESQRRRRKPEGVASSNQLGGKDGLPLEAQRSWLFGEDAKSRRTESRLGERDEREEVMMSQRRRREPGEWLIPYQVKGKLSPSRTAAELAVGEMRSRGENEEDR